MAHNHFVGDASLLIDRRPVPPHTGGTVTADGVLHRPSCIGTLPVVFRDVNGDHVRFHIKDVYAMDSWPNSRVLFSVGQWGELRDPDGHPVFAQTDRVLRFRRGRDITELPYDCARLHTITAVALGPGVLGSDLAAAATPSRPSRTSSEIAQRRLGFVNSRYLASTVNQGTGLCLTDSPSKLPVPSHEAVLHGMAHRAPLVHTSTDPLRTTIRNWLKLKIPTMSFDVHGPFLTAVNGARYFSHFLTCSGMAFVFFHRRVDEATLLNGFKSACLELGSPGELRLDRNQTLIRNDRIVVTAFEQLYLDRGIALKVSPPRHQEFDGRAEKSGGRDVYEHSTALLHFAGDRKSTRLNSSHVRTSRMPSSA